MRGRVHRRRVCLQLWFTICYRFREEIKFPYIVESECCAASSYTLRNNGVKSGLFVASGAA